MNRALAASGVTIVFGTDIMNALGKPSRGVQALEYIDSFVEAGVAAADILRGMTTLAARLLDVQKERGSLAPGMAADIIAVPGNPLKDINTLKEVSFVMKNGITYRHEKR